MKKLLCLALVALLLTSLFMSVGAFSVGAATDPKYEYTIKNKKAIITNILFEGGDLKIPSKLGGYPVVELSSTAFWHCNAMMKEITSITIPDSVEKVDWSRFYKYKTLKSITIGSKNKSYTVKDSVVFSKDKTTLFYCLPNKTGNYTIPNSVKVVAENAFCDNSGLKKITLGSAVKQFHVNAVYGCPSLTDIAVNSSNKTYSSQGGVLFNKAGTTLLRCPEGKSSYTIPGTVKTIGEHAFYDCDKLKTITIPNSVTELKEHAFDNCANLTTVTIGNSVKTIGGWAFYDCWKLATVKFGSSVKTISKRAFFGCEKLCNFTFPSSLRTIGQDAFSGCLMPTTLTIPNGVVTIEENAFNSTRMKYLKLPSSVKTIGDGAFSYCARLVSVTIPKGMTTIGAFVFSECRSLQEATLPNDMKTIPRGMFACCRNLKTVVLPKSVTLVSEKAFNCCYDLYKVWYTGSASATQNIAFESKNDDLISATWYCDICDGSHIYTNTCDTTCNKCVWKRTAPHSYKATTKKATLSANGQIVKKCATCGKTKESTIYRPTSFKLAVSSYVYTGNVRVPAVTIKDADGSVISSSNYTISRVTGCKNVGEQKLLIKMKGNYSGSKTLTYKILPSKTTVSKVESATKVLKVTVAKKTAQVTGYQVQYSTSGKFTSPKTKNITSNKTTTTTLSGLKAKTTYYVRVRTYKTVNGVKYYSEWSATKSSKTK